MWRKLSKEAATEVAKEIIKYVLLWGLPPVVGVLGVVTNVPWFYVAVGVILSGAGITTWLVQYDERRTRNRVVYKLKFVRMRIHLAQAGNQVAAVRFGFNLQNTATFPIKFKVETLKSELTSQQTNKPFYPPNKNYVNNTITVPPGGLAFFDDHDISLPQNFKGNTTAELRCRLLYGKAGKFDHELELKKRTFINFTGPTISGGQHWYDL